MWIRCGGVATVWAGTYCCFAWLCVCVCAQVKILGDEEGTEPLQRAFIKLRINVSYFENNGLANTRPLTLQKNKLESVNLEHSLLNNLI